MVDCRSRISLLHDEKFASLLCLHPAAVEFAHDGVCKHAEPLAVLVHGVVCSAGHERDMALPLSVEQLTESVDAFAHVLEQTQGMQSSEHRTI